MSGIRDIQDEAVRRLAETLKQSGLAASETEAIRMAMNMSGTNKKVSDNFDSKKDRTVMGLSNLNKQYEQKQEQDESRRTEEVYVEKTTVVSQQSDPTNEQKHTVETFEEISAEFDDDSQSEVSQGLLNTEQPAEKQAEPERKPEPVKQESKPEPQPQQEAPATPERAPPKKNIAEMEESKVDLTKVFGFKK